MTSWLPPEETAQLRADLEEAMRQDRERWVVQEYDDVWCEWHGHLGSVWTCDYTSGRTPSPQAFAVKVLVTRVVKDET